MAALKGLGTQRFPQVSADHDQLVTLDGTLSESNLCASPMLPDPEKCRGREREPRKLPEVT